MSTFYRAVVTAVVLTAGIGLLWAGKGVRPTTATASRRRVEFRFPPPPSPREVVDAAVSPGLIIDDRITPPGTISTAVLEQPIPPVSATTAPTGDWDGDPDTSIEGTPAAVDSVSATALLAAPDATTPAASLPVPTAGALSAQPACGEKVHHGDARCDGGMCGSYRTSKTSTKALPVRGPEECCASCLADSACLTYMYMHGPSSCFHFEVVADVLERTSGGHSIGFIVGRVAPIPTMPTSSSEPRTYGGLRHSDRCTQDGCTLLYPMAPPPTPQTASQLPEYHHTCMTPQTSLLIGFKSLEESYAPIGAGPAQSMDDCRNVCVTTPMCAAWSYATSTKQQTAGQCTLHPAVASDPRMLDPQISEAGCTTGLVRPGISRLPPGQRGWPRAHEVSQPPPPLPPIPQPSAVTLDNIQIVRRGNCHRQSCLDVHHCARRWPKDRKGKFAFVVADDLNRPKIARRRGEHVRNMFNSSEQSALIAAARAHSVDVVMLLPSDAAAKYPLEADERLHLESVGIIVSTISPWVIPPIYKPKVNGGCTRQDLFRLNAFRLIEYDAVIVYDRDVSVFGDVTDVFRCAALNVFLTSSGPLSPLNLGFIGFKPDLRLLTVAEQFVAIVDYTMHDNSRPPLPNGGYTGGWDNQGFAPYPRNFIGGNCGQGLYWSLYYKNGERNTTELLDKVWADVGMPRPPAYQLDRCTWDYQGDTSNGIHAQCQFGFSCTDVRVLHKKQRPERDFEAGKACFYYPPQLKT